MPLVVTCDRATPELLKALKTSPDLTLIALDSPAGSLQIAHVARALDDHASIMIFCSYLAIPGLAELEEAGVRSILSSLSTLEEFISAIGCLFEGQFEPLSQQHMRIRSALSGKTVREVLNTREIEILRMVANDLTDLEIANEIGVSVRTINTQLQFVYAKLGVRGRAGAVAVGFRKGILHPEFLDCSVEG